MKIVISGLHKSDCCSGCSVIDDIMTFPLSIVGRGIEASKDPSFVNLHPGRLAGIGLELDPPCPSTKTNLGGCEMSRRYFEALLLRANKQGKEIHGKIAYGKPSEDLGGYFEVLRPGVFSKTLKSGNRVYSLWQHKSSEPLGHTQNGTLLLMDGPKSLKIRIIPPDTTWGRDALESVSRGDVTGFSFGFRIPPGGDSWPQKDLREVHEAELVEVSPVTFAAYPANIAVARSMSEERKPHKESRIKVHSDGFICIEQEEDRIDWTGGIL